MKANLETTMTARDLVRALSRHKRMGFLIFCLTIVVLGVVISLRSNAYRSEAKLYLRIGRETVALDPTATTGQTVGVKISRDGEINAVLEILQSRTILEKVVDVVGADEILAASDTQTWLGSFKQQVSSVPQRLLGFLNALTGNNVVGDPRELAIARLTSNIKVTAPAMSPVVVVSCDAQSPELARKIVAAMIDVHAVEHLRLNRTSGSTEFFHDQTTLVGRQLAETTQRLTSLKNELGIASLEGQLNLLETQKAEIQEQHLHNTRELANSEATHRALQKSLDAVEEKILTRETHGVANAAADGMRQKLYDLETRERELLEKYTVNHPFVQEIVQEVEHMRQIYSGESDSRSQSIYEINPTWQKLQMDFLAEDARLAALQATHESLEQQRQAVLADLRKLNDYSLQIEPLQRQADSLAMQYKTYSEKLELTRIDVALQEHQITNVNVLQAATLATLPVGPSKTLVASVALLVALVNGLGIALLADRFDTTMKSPAEVEDTLGSPVLMSIPHAVRQPVRVPQNQEV